MKLFLTFSKKSLFIILASLIVALFLAERFFSAGADGISGDTNALRVSYINGLGVNVDETPYNVKEIVIPWEFSDVYNKYNRIQQRAGFDLTAYRGEKATVYTYTVKDKEDIVVNLIICKKTVVGGDISSVRIDGEMKPLIRLEK